MSREKYKEQRILAYHHQGHDPRYISIAMKIKRNYVESVITGNGLTPLPYIAKEQVNTTATVAPMWDEVGHARKMAIWERSRHGAKQTRLALEGSK